MGLGLNGEIFVPDGLPEEDALKRTTRLAIAAHQDDIEIMAYDGILKCFGSKTEFFTGAVVTSGAGSPRDNIYAGYTDDEMMAVRRREQKKAAFVGEYAAQVLYAYSSGDVKRKETAGAVEEELAKLISAASPEIIYTHNPADKHDTHVAVMLRVLGAARRLPKEKRPKKVYGCEVWRALDWMTDADKVTFNVSGRPHLEASLVGVFDSQIGGGKRYDLATTGRRIANATYAEHHATDEADSTIYAMDLTPLIEDDAACPAAYAMEFIERLKDDVKSRIWRYA
jgi:LmbE family N-acetylglucosaminyl deacetylase